jgi:hypothetical protein
MVLDVLFAAHLIQSIYVRLPIHLLRSECKAGERGLLFSRREGELPSQTAADESDGIRQSPRGDKLASPTLGALGTHERLNYDQKKALQPVSHSINIP